MTTWKDPIEKEAQRYRDGWKHGWLDAATKCDSIGDTKTAYPLAYRNGYVAGQRDHSRGIDFSGNRPA